jgi:glycosyltransferase involved in cell wall biosynthesis
MLFVGRLSTEKGIDVLREAWRGCAGMTLRVAGTGPNGAQLEERPGITLLGTRTAAQVQVEMRTACALVLPSIWYENFPRTLVEAFAAGLPVIASRIGALAELVEDGRTGLLFEPGHVNDLARAMRWADAHPREMAAMGAAARARYDADYTPEINYRQLLAIHRSAMDDTRNQATP